MVVCEAIVCGKHINTSLRGAASADITYASAKLWKIVGSALTASNAAFEWKRLQTRRQATVEQRFSAA
jgi:hypothetical protein